MVEFVEGSYVFVDSKAISGTIVVLRAVGSYINKLFGAQEETGMYIAFPVNALFWFIHSTNIPFDRISVTIKPQSNSS